jgi:hypothetical protein
MVGGVLGALPQRAWSLEPPSPGPVLRRAFAGVRVGGARVVARSRSVPSGQSLVSTVRVLFGLMVVAAVAVGRTMSIVVVGVGAVGPAVPGTSAA